MPKYIAITIGPIVPTLLNASKTREIWSASYLFSWVMKQLASEIRKEELASGDVRLVLPYADPKEKMGVYLKQAGRKGKSVPELYGAGIFPDRIIFASEKEDGLNWTRQCLKQIVNSLATNMGGILEKQGNKQFKTEDAGEFLMNYLNVHLIEKELDSTSNPILELSPILDLLELKKTFPRKKDKLLDEYLSQATLNVKPPSLLAEDAFGGRFTLGKKTIEHLAVARFVNEETEAYRSVEEEDTQSGSLINRYSTQYKKDFIQAHKYVAIVQADGDNIGKTIQNLQKGGTFSPEMAQEFSRLLMEFAISAVKQVDDYGGLTVYAGGDDILFFAPVINRNSQTASQNIFALLQQLDQDFQQWMQQMEKQGLSYGSELPLPTLSFGLSIAYYKFPLYESLSLAQELLFAKAKEENKPQKHNIAFELRKHSGSAFSGMLPLGKADLVKSYSDLLERLFEPGNDLLLSSVAQKLRRERRVLDLAGTDDSRTASFLKNSFNENIHKKGAPKEFLEAVSCLIPRVYDAYPQQDDSIDEEENPKNPHVQLFNLMRSLQFLVDDTTA